MVIIDANVFFDSADPSSGRHQWANRVLESNRGVMGLNQIVLAELLHAGDVMDVENTLASHGAVRLDLPWESCIVAARAFAAFLRRSLKAGERRRAVPLPDFFIGAHAQVTGFELATSDRQRYRAYFPKVRLVD